MTYLEDVERLKLYVSAGVSQHVHHKFKVFRVTDILGHDGEVVSVQQQLTEQLRKMSKEFFCEKGSL